MVKVNGITEKEMLTAVIEGNITEDVINKAKAMLETLNNKTAKNKARASETQTKNIALAREFAQAMENGKTYAVSEIIKLTGTTENSSKVSAVCKTGVENGIFIMVDDYKVENKGRAVKGYRLVETEDETTEGETTED